MTAIAYWVAMATFLSLAFIRAPFGREAIQAVADQEDISFRSAATALALFFMMLTAPLAMGVHLSLRMVLR